MARQAGGELSNIIASIECRLRIMELHVVVGLFGTACYVIAYALVQLRKLQMNAKSYACLNIAGCICSLYSLSFDFNLAAFVSQAFWLLFTLVGMRTSARAHS